jgi:GH35 family endo-1,4-beta-xylanase
MKISSRNFILLLGFLPIFSYANDDWKTEANARIEKHRKENVQIHVTQNGKPVKDAVVKVEMLSHEFLFGSNFFLWEKETTPGTSVYNRRFSDLLNFATLGFYWAGYESVKDKPSYPHSDEVANWCVKNGIQVKGHPLVWNTGEPTWVKDLTYKELHERQTKRAQDCAEHFKDNIQTWDVINELVGWEREQYWGYAPRLTGLVSYHTGKITFAKDCFAAARKGNPNATLLINDYMADDRYVDIISQLNDDNGKPVYDAIGIQAHWHYRTWSNDSIWQILERFAVFGMPIHLTEVTILSCFKNDEWGSQVEDVPTTPEGEIWQRDEVVRFYTMMFSHPLVEAITWWDFSDKGAWRHAPAGLLRKDMSPKPAYDALLKLVKHDWATNETLKTDKTGVAKVRAFRGKYRFTVTLPNGKKITRDYPGVITKGTTDIDLSL